MSSLGLSVYVDHQIKRVCVDFGDNTAFDFDAKEARRFALYLLQEAEALDELTLSGEPDEGADDGDGVER